MWRQFLRWARSRWSAVQGTAEDLWDDFEPAAEAIMDAGGKAFVRIVYDAVKLAESTGGSGSDKLIAAKKHIQNNLRIEGKTVLEQTINLAIELVLSRLKRS